MVRDVRYACRSFRRAPLVALTMALAELLVGDARQAGHRDHAEGR